MGTLVTSLGLTIALSTTAGTHEGPGQTLADAQVLQHGVAAPWLMGGGAASMVAGASLLAGVQVAAVGVTWAAGASSNVVGTVAVPLVGPALAMAQSGVPDDYLPVAAGVIGAQLGGVGLCVAGGILVAAGVVLTPIDVSE